MNRKLCLIAGLITMAVTVLMAIFNLETNLVVLGVGASILWRLNSIEAQK